MACIQPLEGHCVRLKSAGTESTWRVQNVHEGVNKYSVHRAVPSFQSGRASEWPSLHPIIRREPWTIDATVRARGRARLKYVSSGDVAWSGRFVCCYLRKALGSRHTSWWSCRRLFDRDSVDPSLRVAPTLPCISRASASNATHPSGVPGSPKMQVFRAGWRSLIDRL